MPIQLPARTSRGQLRISDARLSPEVPEGGSPSKGALIRFDLAEDGGAAEVGSCDLLELAACMPSSASDEAAYPRLVELARRIGPLFGGGGEGTCAEALSEWCYAAHAAQVATRIQEFVNGSSQIGELSSSEMVDKRRIASTDCDAAGVFLVAFGAEGAYAKRFDRLPIAKEVACEENGVIHVLAWAEKQPQPGPTIVCCAATFPGNDSWEALQSIVPGPEDLGEGMERLVDASEPVDFSNKDTAVLAALVKTIACLHLSGTHATAFRDERTDLIVSDDYLSWLWYDFTCLLNDARIGYCQQCGRAFSLKGHRGMARRFCSDECKTAAKNQRARDDAKRARALFDEGLAVDEIASEVYGGGRAAEKKVRDQLSSWTSLKHRLDDSIEEDGWDGSALLARCGAEGLDLDRMLSERRRHERREREERQGRTS